VSAGRSGEPRHEGLVVIRSPLGMFVTRHSRELVLSLGDWVTCDGTVTVRRSDGTTETRPVAVATADSVCAGPFREWVLGLVLPLRGDNTPGAKPGDAAPLACSGSEHHGWRPALMTSVWGRHGKAARGAAVAVVP
jgi:hypothetical protein